MAFLTSTATCDVYRSGNAPPAAPDVAAVPCVLTGAFEAGTRPVPTGISTALVYTHVMLVDPSADIRDSYSGQGNLGAGQDTVYVPDRTGTAFRVVFVERVGQGTPGDAKRVYLDRQAVAWPTTSL